MSGLRLLSSALVTGLLLFPALGMAQEESTVSGSASILLRAVDGERESAKFQEYRDLEDGVAGDFFLLYRRPDGYFLDLGATKIGQDDQNFTLKSGRYGRYRLEIGYDELPHRFAFDAKTLYSGIGSGNLVISNRVQADLQGSTSANDLARRVNQALAGASSVDLELKRKTGSLAFDLMTFDPFNVRVELSREKREGARPFFGSFGFGNTVEIAEPIDYDTTQFKVIAEYAGRPFYVNATYYLSIFENNIGTVSWSNPFRAVDSTTPTAYTTTFAAGPSRGLIDLYPDNIYHNISLSGAVMDLPFRTRVSVTASWGWMDQDDDLVAHTTNTAIRRGAVSGVAGVPVPFDAFDRANLPRKTAEASVMTSLYTLLVTSRPLQFLDLKARYRYYDYDNNTDQTEFFGHARFDAVWEPHVGEAEASVPTSYTKHTAGIEAGLDVLPATKVTLGYTYEKTKRTNREVDSQDEHIGKVAADAKPLSWLDLRASYERAQRSGKYNFLIPFLATHLGEELEEPVPQLPFLRKYDEANRDRDRVQFLATVYPIEPVSLTGSAMFTRDDFSDSPFGLRDTETQTYGLDAEYAVTDRLNLFAFYIFERIESNQKARQWTPGGVGDPFTREPGLASNSNWTAKNEDTIHTVGGGVEFTIVPGKLDARLAYSYSQSDGKIRLASPVGTAANDNNAFAPLNFTDVDDVRFHTLNARLRYHFRKDLTIALGYMWEKYDIGDFNNTGVTNVPTTATGAYNAALLMGTLPKSYDANIVYAVLTYTF